MDLSRWRHVVGLADAGSFTAAAVRLHISQPALSRSIQATERGLGLKLFDRSAAGTVVTPAGRSIVEQARALLGQARALEVTAAQIAKGDAGRVRFGVGPMFAALLDEILPRLWQAHQPVTVQAHILPVERLVARLLRGELDFFIADGRAARGHALIAIEAIGRDPVGYFVRADHPLARSRGLSLSDIIAYPRVSPNLPDAGIEDDPDINRSVEGRAGHLHCERFDLLAAIAASSDAILLAMESMLRLSPRGAELVRLDIPPLAHWSSDVVLARSAGASLAPAVERYAETMRAAIASHIAESTAGIQKRYRLVPHDEAAVDIQRLTGDPVARR